MSNLIKSGKVVDLGIPVNVGVSYNFNNSKSSIVEKIAPVSQHAPIAEKTNTNSTKPVQQEVPQISQEEIMNKYIEEAKKKADEFFQSEMKRAYEEGIQKANEEALAIIENAGLEREAILDEVVKIKEEALNEYKEEVKGLEKDVINLSLDIAEKILNYEIDRSDQYVLGIVKDALDRVLSKKDVVLKLSTADYYTILSNKKYLVSNVKGFGEIEIVQDESMDPGSCIVDTPLGIIDGGIQARMDNIQKEVMKMIVEQ